MDRARDILRSIYGDVDRNNVKSLKVVLVDPTNETQKIVKADLGKDDILSNAFIRKVLLDGFDTPLKECDSEIRADIRDKMKAMVNVEAV